ncbi:MAG: PKD domain-containing protein [Gammaproteobacteria bacterium]|nr:PKD domain-containing protein [Gammaproteobacteria bacterium]
MKSFRYQLIVLTISVLAPVGLLLASVPSATSGPLPGMNTVSLTPNQVRTEKRGQIIVDNPNHTALFTHQGIDFQPTRGPGWRWQLQHFGTDAISLSGKEGTVVDPEHKRPGHIDFARGKVTERYVIRPSTIEQQFIISEPLDLGGSDLIVDGRIQTEGRLQRSSRPAEKWVWRNEQGAISLGGVTVFDASGNNLPASMTVSQNTTRIRVDGAALSRAVYPVTIDPEVGADDFQISNPGDAMSFDSGEASVAYNATDNEYAVVWWGDNATSGDQEFVIFLEILDASNGSVVLAETIIGDNGLTGAEAPRFPDIVWNSTDNEYLVVWRADDGSGPPDPKEIYGQLLDSDGAEIGVDFQISNIASVDPARNRDANFPAVAYNSTDNQYLVVWQGDGAATDGDREIFGQIMTANGTVVLNDFQISQHGTANAIDEQTAAADVAYNPVSNEYLVVWEGDTATGATYVAEIFGQITAADGATVLDDFQISQSGSASSDSYDSSAPSVAASANGEYLVVWYGDHLTLGDNGNFNVYAQRLNAAGVEQGSDFRISNTDMADLDPSPRPGIVYNPVNDEYFVAWPGTATVIAERVAADGSVAEDDFELSDDPVVGVVPAESYPLAAVAHSTGQDEYLTVWVEDPGATGQNVVFGQRFAPPATLRFANANPSVGEGGGTTTLTVNRVGYTITAVTVDVSSSDGTAMVPGDYTAVSDTLSFGMNETARSFVVTVVDDTEVEADETVNLTLSNPTPNPIPGAVLAANGASAVLTIVENDVNLPPVANAGLDQAVIAGVLVTLDGSASSDPNAGDTITYAWTQTVGDSVTLADADTATPSFTALGGNTPLTFELTVTDSGTLTGTDTVTITVSGGTAPAADAGADITVEPGGTVTLDGTASSDPNGDALTFSWTQTGGEAVTLNAADTATPNFTAPGTEQALVFELSVSDGTESGTDSVTITVAAGGGGSGSSGLGALSLLLMITSCATSWRRRRDC